MPLSSLACRSVTLAALAASGVLALAVSPVAAASRATELVSVASDGGWASGHSGVPAMSGDGRFIAFLSSAEDLVAGDTNGAWDIFVRDRRSGSTERVSVASDGAQTNWDSRDPAISADGRFVAFASPSRRLVPGDTNGVSDVFVHDRYAGTTDRVSVSADGVQSDSGYMTDSNGPALSADGRFVAFASGASNLVAGDTNGTWDVFVRDRQAGTTERVSVASDGTQAVRFVDGFVHCTSDPTCVRSPAISADGRVVAFSSFAPNMVAGDTNGTWDVFVHDRATGTTELISVGSDGTQANAASVDNLGGNPISADGRFVAFASTASNLVSGDTNASPDIFVRDRRTGSTQRVSLSSGGAQANSGSEAPAISADGRFITFSSRASNLVAGDTNGVPDVFVHDLRTGRTERVSLAATGVEGNRDAYSPAVSADGGLVAFGSLATNLLAGDFDGAVDLFVRSLAHESGGESCTMKGGAGDDILIGTPGDDVICGMGGDDHLSGGGGQDVLRGDDGEDRLAGGAGPDLLEGGAGNDHLDGGTGPDALAGGDGVDRASYYVRTEPVTLTIGDGPNDGTTVDRPGPDLHSLERDDVRADVEQLAGGQGDDAITGNADDNLLSGNAGDDRLTGGAGRDELVGGDGDDHLDARDAGPDRLSCGPGLDTALSDPIDWLSTTCENH